MNEEPIPGGSVLSDYVSELGPQYLANQADLDSFFEWLAGQPGIGASGYIGGIDDVDRRSTKLMWKGESTLQETAVAEGARRGLTVTVQPRKYDAQDLTEAAQAVLASADDPKWKGFQVRSVSALGADFDGLQIGGKYASARANKLSAASDSAPARTAVAAAAIEESDGIPVKIVPTDGGQPWVATRGNDSAPYNAGGFIYSSSLDGYCSTGFSVRINGQSHTITARHCAANDWKAARGSGDYGRTLTLSTDGGARVLTAKGSKLMFDGAWNDSKGYKKEIQGYGDVRVNDRVCTSGGMTGVHCGISILNLVHFFDDDDNRATPDLSMIEGWQAGAASAIAGGPGDSGGPVLQPVADNEVKAVGMIQGGTADTDCGSTAAPLPRGICGKRVYFTAMRTIVNTLPDADLVHG